MGHIRVLTHFLTFYIHFQRDVQVSGKITIIPKPELRCANPSHSSTPAMTARWNWSVQRLDVSHMSFVKLSKWNTYQNSSTNLAVSFTNLSHLLSRRVWFELSLLARIALQSLFLSWKEAYFFMVWEVQKCMTYICWFQPKPLSHFGWSQRWGFQTLSQN